MEASCRVDTGDPEPAEIALAIPPVAVRVGLGAIDRLSGSSEQTSASAEVPLGLFEDLFPPPPGSDAGP